MIKYWAIKPASTPIILKNCSRCGCQSEFNCSNQFRVNAQQRNLDVWLIYKCKRCNCTWNMDIYSRVRPQDLPPEQYEGFLHNDATLAARFACDAQTIKNNKVKADFEHLSYRIVGDLITVEEVSEFAVNLSITIDYGMPVRLDKILSEGLGISRNKVKAMIDASAVVWKQPGGGEDGVKLLLKGKVTLRFNPLAVQAALGVPEEKADNR